MPNFEHKHQELPIPYLADHAIVTRAITPIAFQITVKRFSQLSRIVQNRYPLLQISGDLQLCALG